MSRKQGGRGRPNQREEDGALIGRRNRGGSDQPGGRGAPGARTSTAGSGPAGVGGSAWGRDGPQRAGTPARPKLWEAGALGSREPGRPERQRQASREIWSLERHEPRAHLDLPQRPAAVSAHITRICLPQNRPIRAPRRAKPGGSGRELLRRRVTGPWSGRGCELWPPMSESQGVLSRWACRACCGRAERGSGGQAKTEAKWSVAQARPRALTRPVS
jgi:hypothetical protein